MEVSFHANVSDRSTWPISRALQPPLSDVARDLDGDYGGVMEHLWIDFELTPPPAGKRRTFRLQKRVSGRSPFGGPAIPDSYNVGHYCVYPDLPQLIAVPISDVVPYALSIISGSMTELDRVAKRLRGFDVALFRSRFVEVCAEHGYALTVPATNRTPCADQPATARHPAAPE